MELNYDWPRFRSIFRMPETDAKLNAVTSITDGERVVSASSLGEDFSVWAGKNFSDLGDAFPSRKHLRIERDQVEKILMESLKLPHIQAQILSVKENFAKQTGVRKDRGHFLLDALKSRWTRILPASYGIYIRLTDLPKVEEIFCVVRSGRIEAFHLPDLSSFGHERSKDLSSAVKYLSEKYLLPVQGIHCPRSEWDAWAVASDPWAAFTASFRAKRTQIAPFRWKLVFLFTCKRICSKVF